MKKIRAFLAVEMDDSVCSATGELIEQLAATGAAVNWVPTDHLHLTLKFFGDIEEVQSYEISKAVTRVTKRYRSFPINLAGVGAFPSNERPRTLWVGVTAGQEVLCDFQSALEKSLAELGYPSERRKFQPHLTIGRVRDKAGQSELATALRELQDTELGVSAIRSAILFRSELRRSGPVYSKLATCQL